MKTIVTILVLLGSNAAYAQQGTQLYDANGRVIGRAVPSGQGSVNYYDSMGRTTGRSTTTNSGTIFYDAMGRQTGRAASPPPSRK